MSKGALVQIPLFDESSSRLNFNYRRAGHKAECGEGSPSYVALKLAERALAVPKIAEYLQMHSILTLKLLEDRSNAERYVVNVKCRTEPADLMSYMSRMMSGENKDSNAQILLNVASFEKVAWDDAPASTKKRTETAREMIKSGYWTDGLPTAGDNIILTVFLTSVAEDEDGNFKVDGGQDGAVSATFLLPEHAMKFMADSPKSTIRSAMFGDTEVDLNESTLRE